LQKIKAKNKSFQNLPEEKKFVVIFTCAFVHFKVSCQTLEEKKKKLPNAPSSLE
jgi:hypothetical protein